ncbi:MAG: PAS domain S-box protein [Puia sp.]|nr:PAS domain S-box protein [Puia sp.]
MSDSNNNEAAAKGQRGQIVGAEDYHRMVEEVEDYAILMLDREGFIRNWNRGAEKIKGYTEQEIVGKHFRIFYAPGDQLARLPEKLIGEAMEHGKAVHEGWRIRKNGTTFWGSIVITALHDEVGNVVGFSKVTRDLTERKESEDRLVRYALQLESQNKELQQFAFAAAHDMKEPLRKIQFYNSTVLAEGGERMEVKLRTYLERSSDAAGRMQVLIEDLLAFTKITEPFAQFTEVDMNSIVAEVSAFYQEALDSVEGLVVASTLPKIKGIPFQIRQLFVNLLGNSVKYHQEGRPLRIDITVEEVDGAGIGDKGLYPSGRFLKLSFRDNGIGFEAKYAERIFGMFQRLHNRKDYQGTGLGLSICRKIMEIHKGYIRAAGEEGMGSVFDLFFPI